MSQPLILRRLPGQFAVYQLEPTAPLPGWAAVGEFFSITRTADELSIVCNQSLVSDGVRCEKGWRCLRVAGTMDFSMIGVVASLATLLSEAGVSVFVVSTFDTDYLLVKESDLERAAAALRAAGHQVG